ncbi:MAG: hypothetical protein ACRC4M_04575 [Mycoplasma sp.]
MRKWEEAKRFKEYMEFEFVHFKTNLKDTEENKREIDEILGLVRNYVGGGELEQYIVCEELILLKATKDNAEVIKKYLELLIRSIPNAELEVYYENEDEELFKD